MPRLDRSLTRTEIASVLRNIADHPPNIPAGVALEAMVVTANSLMPHAPDTDVALPHAVVVAYQLTDSVNDRALREASHIPF